MISSELTLYFLLTILALCTQQLIMLINSPDNMFQIKGNYNMMWPVLLSVIFIFWLGHRRIFLGGFVDTANYGREYINLQPSDFQFSLQSEWLWSLLMNTCKKIGLSATDFFTVVEAGYILPLIWAVKKFMPSNVYIGLLFVWGSLFFLPFGVNGIRNGLACNLLFLAIAFLFEGKYWAGGILAFLCFGIHRSTMLPIAATVFAIFLFRDVEKCVYMWLMSIVLSLFAGGWFTAFFAGLGFDERMSSYSAEQDMSMFSQSGFRWDFLLYSSIPVFMSYYICVKKRISDNWYNAICTIYLLCNSFWVLVIRASYSNRFAYLSWFIYPLVIAYPLVVLPVWFNQDSRTGIILILYIIFTFVMNFYWHSF